MRELTGNERIAPDEDDRSAPGNHNAQDQLARANDMSSFSRAFGRLQGRLIQAFLSGQNSHQPLGRRHDRRQALIEALESRQLLSAVYPEIELRGNGLSIPSGNTTFSTADFTDFGSADINTGSSTHLFQIANTGDGVLNITGATRVKLSGTNPGDFKVITQPAATVAALTGTTSFSVKFDPTATGARSATITIYNDDDDEDPYTFDIQGTGTAVPKASVLGNGVVIPAGDTVTRTTDATDFGSTESAAGSIAKTFTIRNTGSADLTFTATPITITGADAALFAISGGPANGATLTAGTTQTFVVTYTPAGATGVANAVIHVNTADEPTFPDYQFNIKANAITAPVIDVQGGAGPTSITPGSISIGTADAAHGTDFGSADVSSGLVTHTFTINNNGSGQLKLTGTAKVTISGSNPGDFVVTSQPGATIASAGNDTFDIKFDPKGAGVRSALVSISSNDTTAGHSPYKFIIKGTGTTSPIMTVAGLGNAIPTGNSAFSSTDGTDMGSTPAAFSSLTQTFAIKNTGSAVLTLGAGAVSFSGADAADFTVLTQPPTSIAAGGSGTFTIQVTPSTAAAEHTTIQINNNDAATGGTYTFDAQATGLAVPRLEVEGNSTTIASGDDTPNTGDFTDFGSVDISGGTIVKAFDVNNLGTGTLTFSGASGSEVTITGPAASDFTVSTPVSGSTVAAAGSDSFSITFDPTATGPRIALVTIGSDDPLDGNNPYTFVIQGTGTSNVAMLVKDSTDATTITDGTLVPAAGVGTDFGTVNIGAASVTTTFTIDNTGTDALNLVGTPLVLIDGTFASDFLVSADPDASVAAGGSTTFDITFSPSGSGLRTASVTIFSDDSNHPSYTFNIQGTGAPQPAIQITGNNVLLANDGSNTPAVGENTDFGSAVNGAQTVSETFVVTNNGTAPLNIASGGITFSGADAADFSTAATLPVSIQPGASWSFDVDFLPTSAAAENADVLIASDDPNVASYDIALTGTGIDSGVAQVSGNGQVIPKDSPSASPFNDTNFGKVEVNTGKISKTFTITNIGSDDLTFTADLAVAGGNAGDFTISNAPQNTDVLTPGSSATFQVAFDPAATGLRTTTLTITTDDGIDTTYTFVLQGQGVNAPSMQVQGAGLAIPSGDMAPRPADRTDFGSTEIANASKAITKTFTIKNVGSAALSLSGTPKVKITGSNATDFAVITQPGASVAAGGQTTFSIRYVPAAEGPSTATVSIASNDATQSPYTFAITGEGVASGVMGVKGNNTAIANGDLTPSTSDFTDLGGVDVSSGTITKTFTIFNSGSAPLSLTGSPVVTITGADAGDFAISTQPASSKLAAKNGSTTFSVQFDPSAAGTRFATINIASDDPNADVFTYSIQGTGLVSPIMNVKGGTTPTTISSGDTTPSAADGTDFGAVEQGNGTVTRTFTINNTGAGVLRLINPRVAIDNTTDFTIVAQPSDRIAAGSGSSSFQIKFDPQGGTGVKTGNITITSDDPTAPSYTFRIQGTGSNLPIMNIQYGGNDVSTGTNTIDMTIGTDFGSTDIGNTNVQHTFTIQNNGTGALTLSGAGTHVSITGANAADFTVQTAPGASVAAGNTTTFVIKFDPSAVGVRTATISIPNTDSPRNPYTFSVRGIGTSAPAVQLWGGAGPSQISNHAAAAAGIGSDFGNTEINAGSTSKTFTIKNLGSAALSLTGTPIVQISGADAADFTVTTQPTSSTIAATTGTNTFTIKFDPSSAGTKNATVTVLNNDTAFDFALTGVGVTAPIIALQGGSSVAINKGATSASTGNQTDFGQVPTNGGTLQRTYTIRNNGSATLNITSITAAGGNAGDFAISNVPSSIAPNSTATFNVTLTPSATGARSTTISVVSDDVSNTPYTFVVAGTGTVAPIVSVVGGAGPAAITNNASAVTGAANGTDFGSTDITGGTVTHTFTIKNTGAGALTLSGSPLVTITGANASDFTVVTQPGSSVAATTGTTSIVVKFDPSAAGVRNAVVNFTSNDNTNHIWHFAISGTGTTAPAMDVQGGSPAVSIPSGDTSVAAAKGLDFGNVEINFGTAAKTYTIRNTGSDALNFSGSPIVSIGGVNPADFSVVYSPRRSVAAGGNTDFQILFDPSASGVRSAVISIASDDGSHNPYTFKVQGTGITAPLIQLSGNSQVIAKGDTTPLAGDGTNFGSVSASSGSVINTFTITNLGSGTLNLTATGAKVTLSNSTDFSVSTVPGSNAITAGNTTTFAITFDPTTTGIKTCTVTILNDDPNGSPFTFVIQGTGI